MGAVTNLGQKYRIIQPDRNYITHIPYVASDCLTFKEVASFSIPSWPTARATERCLSSCSARVQYNGLLGLSELRRVPNPNPPIPVRYSSHSSTKTAREPTLLGPSGG